MKKRVLSLLLALGCVLSLSVPALAADPAAFTDAAEIEYWEPVAALTSLGVINGREDGSFSADQFLTRAEACKLLCAMGLGGDTGELDQAPVDYTLPYAGHWAGKYINWCNDLGLLDWEGSAFDPDGTVGGSELARMCLCLLGYDPEVYGLTGLDWELNTNSIAFGRLDLGTGFDLMEADLSEPFTRGQAAQLLYNMLRETCKTTGSAGEINGIVIPGQPDALNPDGTPQTFLQANFTLNQLPAIPAQPGK